LLGGDLRLKYFVLDLGWQAWAVEQRATFVAADLLQQRGQIFLTLDHGPASVQRRVGWNLADELRNFLLSDVNQSQRPCFDNKHAVFVTDQKPFGREAEALELPGLLERILVPPEHHVGPRCATDKKLGFLRTFWVEDDTVDYLFVR